MAATREQILVSLCKAYNMEIETVANYLANSLHLDGVRADFIKQALAADIQGELMHAQKIGHRIKQQDDHLGAGRSPALRRPPHSPLVRRRPPARPARSSSAR